VTRSSVVCGERRAGCGEHVVTHICHMPYMCDLIVAIANDLIGDRRYTRVSALARLTHRAPSGCRRGQRTARFVFLLCWLLGSAPQEQEHGTLPGLKPKPNRSAGRPSVGNCTHEIQTFFYCALAVETLYPRVTVAPAIRTAFSLTRLVARSS
jgi:hypothetical protein